MLPRLAICCGEPAGIGLDLLLKISDQAIEATCVIIADANAIKERALLLGIDIELIPYNGSSRQESIGAGQLLVLDISCSKPVIAFSGHTEYLAELTNAKMPVMMLAADKFRVALATTHLPLKDVSAFTNKIWN